MCIVSTHPIYDWGYISANTRTFNEIQKKGEKKQILSDLSEISRQLHTFGRASSYDDNDDEDNKCQEQEGGEDVAQRQEKVVPLLRQDDGDDSRWFSLSCLWAIEEWQQSAFLFHLFFIFSLTNKPVCHYVVYRCSKQDRSFHLNRHYSCRECHIVFCFGQCTG